MSKRAAKRIGPKTTANPGPAGKVNVEACASAGGIIDVWFDTCEPDGMSVYASLTRAEAKELIVKVKKALTVRLRPGPCTPPAERPLVRIGPFDEGTKDESIEINLSPGGRVNAATVIRLHTANRLAIELLTMAEEMRMMPRIPPGPQPRELAAALDRLTEAQAALDRTLGG